MNQLASEALMKTLLQIVAHVFPDHVAQMLFAEEHEIIETLVLNRFHGSDQEMVV